MSYQKCEFKPKGYLEIGCEALRKAAECHPTKRSKGLFTQSRIRLSDGESLGTLVLLKTGEFRERGIALNFCPFCGNKVRDTDED